MTYRMDRTSLALIGLLAFSMTGGALAQREPSDEEKERNRVRIGITREQQKELEAAFADARKQEFEIHAKTRELYRQLFEIYDNYDFERDQAKSVRVEIGKLNRKRMLIHAETQEKLRRILTREQFDRMTQLTREKQEKWRKEHPRRGPPPDRG